MAQQLDKAGIFTSSLYGEMSDVERRSAVHAFIAGKATVLVANRQLGGRGFDLPMAHYCVFLTAKRDPQSMWQEMLRIRSSKRITKTAYILYYSETEEVAKLEQLLTSMREAESGCNIEVIGDQKV